MAFGISVISSGGFTQIDETYGNFRIIQSGTIVMGIYDSQKTVSFPTQSVTPLVFVRPPYGGQIWGSTGNQTISNSNFTISTFAAMTVKYVVCVPINGSGSDTFGMRVYGPSGQTTFDAAHNLISLDHFMQITMNNYHQGVTTVAVPTPPVGERYILLNPLVIHSIVVTDFDNQMGNEYYLTAQLNSESSITYKSEGMPFSAYQTWSTNGARTLLSGYVNI